ncbi:glycosyltransferase family 2 protein [Methanobrevibacter sp.]|uniref:glycosyltransferase family 2 protein n=1 Tax=Methanobrevibacter sp. TaxID=66852 RepID=UPI00388EA919
MVKISVIVPVYNVEKYLSECMDSLVNQTFEDIEIICVNDGSTDTSPEILENYAKEDRRIKIISQENQGLGAARNRGIKHSNGDYLFFIDSDDFLELNTLKLLYDNAVSNDSDIVFYRLYKYLDGEKINFPMYRFNKIFKDVDFDHFTFDYHNIKTHVLNGGYNSVVKLYKKAFLDRYDDFYFTEGIAFEDVLFHVKVMLRAKRISHVPQQLYYYRINENSIMNTPKYTPDIFKVVDMVVQFMEDNNLTEEFRPDLDYFKMRRIDAHLLKSYSEEYFQIAKKRYEEIKFTELFREDELRRFNLLLSSDNFNEYLINLYETDKKLMNDANTKLHNENRKYRKQNDKLKKEISKIKAEKNELSKRNDELKKTNEEIISSNSWKLTKPLRKTGKLFR